MKTTLILLVLIIGFAFFMRINLPLNTDIDKHISQQQKSADPALDFIGKAMSKIIYSDTVADWQFVDFIVVKYACSENLKIKMVAYPLQKWQLLEDNIRQCDDYSF